MIGNKYDIALLQETYCDRKLEKLFRLGWQGNVFHSFAKSNHSSGVCILMSKDISYELLNVKSDDNGRLLLVNIRINREIISIGNIYSPNQVKERCVFFNSLITWITEHCMNLEGIIMGGDFNCAPSEIDREYPICKKSAKCLDDIRASLKIVDVWRHHCSNFQKMVTIS